MFLFLNANKVFFLTNFYSILAYKLLDSGTRKIIRYVRVGQSQGKKSHRACIDFDVQIDRQKSKSYAKCL